MDMSRARPSIPYEAIQTVFLDVGNTLVSMDFTWIKRELDVRQVPCTVDGLRRAESAARPTVSAELHRFAKTPGPGAFDFYLRNILQRLEGPPEDLDGLLLELIPIFTAPGATQRLWSSVLPGVVPSLEKLRAWGLNLIVVSNSDGTVEESLIQQGLRPYFSSVVDSHWVGFEKPDPRIFQHALSRCGDPVERILHVGDIYHADVLGARAVGIHAILLDPFDDWPELDCERAADLTAVVARFAAVLDP